MNPRLCLICVLCLIGLSACASAEPPLPPLDLPGPTLASRTLRGYELRNRHVVITIDPNSGDVISWKLTGLTTGFEASLLIEVDVRAASVAATTQSARSVGYIEARDDQTWQYIGDDAANGLRWRRIYCLDGDRLNVSSIVQNLRKEPITITQFLHGTMNPPGISTGAEQFTATNQMVSVSLHAYNEFHDQPARSGAWLCSDTLKLQPGERISWTMTWEATRIPI